MGGVPTILRRKRDLDHLVSARICRRRPADTGFSRRACRVLVLTVDREVLGRKTRGFLGLPMIILTGRTIQIDAVLFGNGNQQLGIEKAGIDEMGSRQNLALR